MAYCTAADVKLVTGAKPETFRLEKTDTLGLDAILDAWIELCEGHIDAYCHTNFDVDTPKAVKSVCIRMAANMVAFSQARKDTPLVKVSDWNVQITSSSIFTSDLKSDLEPFVVNRRSSRNEIDFAAITGDDPTTDEEF